MAARKWKMGKQLDLHETVDALADRKPIYYRGKWTHAGWAGAWQFNMIIGGVMRGLIREAIKIEEQDNATAAAEE
jgi:hypothetical protein